MSHNKIPRTPFSTRLSGSAKETEGRLKNLFSGPKRRPPVLLLALVFALCLLCGNLVSCQRGEEETPNSSSVPAGDSSSGDGLADGEARWMLYWEKAVQTLFEQREDYSPDYGGGEVLFNMAGEEKNLLLAAWTPGAHTGGFRNLLLGCFDQEGALTDFYEVGGDSGLWSVWEEGNVLHLLCANSTTYTGEETSGPPMYFQFDGKTLTQVDEVPETGRKQLEDVPERLSQWESWGDHKYLPRPGLVEVYRRTPGWTSMDPKWRGVPQWEYLGVVHFADGEADPTPEPVYTAAREYIDGAEWEGVPTAGTPILRLEETARWSDFSQLSLCREWRDREDLTLVAWDLDYGDPGESSYMDGQTHLLFLQERDKLTFLTTFYDGYPLESPPEQELLAGLSPYNWYAVEALYDAGYLTARPRLADIFTKVPVPQQAWTLAEECLAREGFTLRVDAMEPRYFCVEEPHWMGVYAIETSSLQNGTWEKQPARLGFFKLSSFRSFEMCVCTMPESEINILDAQTRAAAHGLLDYEVALWDLQYPENPTAYGPGNFDGVFTAQGSAETMDGWVETGDRYEAHYIRAGWNNRFCTRLDTTRRLPTTRGVKMGDSRDKVRERYPELRDEPFPGLEGDYLWYCAGTPETRASLVFFFEDDTLSRMVLTAPLEDGN